MCGLLSVLRSNNFWWSSGLLVDKVVVFCIRDLLLLVL